MKTSKIFIIAASLSLLCACSKIVENTEGEGTLSISIEGMTKAAMSESELLQNADIRIYKADFSGLVRAYKYSEMPATLYLPADSYRIDVSAGEIAKDAPQIASWEQKSYKGSKEVSVLAGQNSSVTIAANVCNVISKLSFDSSIAANFNPGFSCRLGLSKEDDSQTVTYTASQDGKEAYFIASGFEPSLFWDFSGTLSKNGETFTRSGEIKNVEAGKRYAFALQYSEKDGVVVLEIKVDDSTNDIYDDIIFIPVSTGISATPKHEIWAGHFTAHADVDEGEYDASKVFFEYRAEGSASWNRIAAEREAEGSFKALISGLTPDSSYEYRLALTAKGSDVEETLDAPSTIRTDIALQAPNSGFEVTSNDESKNYYSLYNPASSDAALKTKWWCNGNKGSTTVGSKYQICYPDKDTYKEGSQSICLSSLNVVVKFAAGNLFSGHFGKTIGTEGGTVFFGRPFSARPTAMRLWAKYSGGTINHRASNAPSEVQKGDYDKASLRIALGNWDYKKYGGDADSPVLINTTDTGSFVDFSTDASTIAFGELIMSSDSSNSTNTWRQITIPLNYRNTNSYPSHIIISFAASMYGDYFTGCDKSKLWIDAVELLYE